MFSPENLKLLIKLIVFINILAGIISIFPKARKIGFGIFTLGWIGSMAAFVINWQICGQPPFGNMFHVMVFLGCCFLPCYLLLKYREKLAWTLPYFCFIAGCSMIGAIFKHSDEVWLRPPVLHSPWFVPHVFAYMLSYSLAGVAFALTITEIIRKPLGMDPAPQNKASYQVLLLSFPFMTFGLLSGSLWAEEAWGRYWAWDIKEIWSLITWMLYLIYFHCRKSPKLKQFTTPTQILAFTALITTFILVNVMKLGASSMHSYGR